MITSSKVKFIFQCLVVSMLFTVLVMNPDRVWAGPQCDAAKNALAGAQDNLTLKNAKVKKTQKALEEAKAKAKKADKAANDAIDAEEDAEAEMKAAQKEMESKTWRNYDQWFGTETYKEAVASKEKYETAKKKYRDARFKLEPLLDAADAADDEVNRLDDHLYYAQKDVETAEKDVKYWEGVVKDRCKSSLEDAFKALGFGESGDIVQGYKQQAQNNNQEDRAIEENERQNGGSSGSSSSSSSTTIGVSANCDVNSGTGTSTLSLNGTSFCSVTGTASVFSSGSSTQTCTPGSTVTLSLSCTATNCRINLGTVSPSGLNFTGLTNGINGPFTGVTSFTGTCP